MSASTDPTRLCGAILLEDLARLANRLAQRLRSNQTMQPITLGRLLVDADRIHTKLSRHAERLQVQPSAPSA